MVALPDADRIADLGAEIRRLRKTVRKLVVLMDAMREAWLLPPVGVLQAERRALKAAEGSTCPPLPVEPLRDPRIDGDTGDPDAARRARSHKAALDRIRDAGYKAAARGLTPYDCPYKGASGGFRAAWLSAHAKGLERRQKALDPGADRASMPSPGRPGGPTTEGR